MSSSRQAEIDGRPPISSSSDIQLVPSVSSNCAEINDGEQLPGAVSVPAYNSGPHLVQYYSASFSAESAAAQAAAGESSNSAGGRRSSSSRVNYKRKADAATWDVACALAYHYYSSLYLQFSPPQYHDEGCRGTDDQRLPCEYVTCSTIHPAKRPAHNILVLEQYPIGTSINGADLATTTRLPLNHHVKPNNPNNGIISKAGPSHQRTAIQAAPLYPSCQPTTRTAAGADGILSITDVVNPTQASQWLRDRCISPAALVS